MYAIRHLCLQWVSEWFVQGEAFFQDNTKDHIWRDSDQRLAVMCIVCWTIWVQVLVRCVCNCECHVGQQD